jgi:PAS domain S-box-containing protein
MATTFTKRCVRVLHLEDNENDQVLVGEMLRASGLNCKIVAVKTRDEFQTALKSEGFDLIISDFSLPSFDGLSALSIAREIAPQTPFVFFSGTIGEEVAVESLKNGATDYILKQRPNRLTAAVNRALQSVQERARLERVEGELHKMEDRLRIVARASDDVVWEWDIASNQIWFSENFQNVFGYSRDEIGARPEKWQKLIHPDERNRVISSLTAMVASGGRVWWSEHRLRRANGLYLHVYDRATVVYDNTGKPLRMVGVVIDMTNRKTAEEKIREQAALLDKAQDAIIVCTMDRTITYWNKGAERLYGWSTAEAIGKNIRQLLFHGNPPAQINDIVKNLEKHGEWVGELPKFTKDNKPVIVQARSTLIRDHAGQPKSLLLIYTDITERKQLEEQFLRVQRLESLGALVGGIAHDLNNALAPILIGVEILREQTLSPDAMSMVSTMETTARRSADMVKQMLLFARGGEKVKTIFSVDQLAKEIARTIADTFPKNIKCRVKGEKACWPVSGFPTQLHQVLLNLCVNARDAMPSGGTLTVCTENVKLSPAEAADHHGVKPGHYLCLTVADTGTGIPPEVADKIFQPFFTTKGPGKGTGLGLSICQNIVKSHDGFITVQSTVGAGTEFKVYLPAASSEPPPTAIADKTLPPAGNGERVLVVDDEESILAITHAALSDYGYEVLTAGSGPEAITRFAQNVENIHLVISDFAMPLMDGGATVTAMRKIRPDLKVIMISGSEKEMEDYLKQIKHDVFIAKPFTKETLLKTVHEVLTGDDRQENQFTGLEPPAMSRNP